MTLRILVLSVAIGLAAALAPTHAAAQASQQDIVDYINNLRLSEVQALIDALEAQLGVQASTPTTTSTPSSSDDAKPEQTEFDCVLNSYGAKKIGVIKAVRAMVPGVGLKEAKTLVESAPVAVKEAVPIEEAEECKLQLEAAGAEVQVK